MPLPDNYAESQKDAASDRDSNLAAIADAILGGEDVEFDMCVMYEALRPVLPRDDFVALGAMLELCPLHYCDIRICEDDGIHGDEVYGPARVGVPEQGWPRREPPKWTVVDTHGVKPGERTPILGRFSTHDEAAAFIGTLPDCETGRYGLDGPSDAPSREQKGQSDE